MYIGIKGLDFTNVFRLYVYNRTVIIENEKSSFNTNLLYLLLVIPVVAFGVIIYIRKQRKSPGSSCFQGMEPTT